MSRSGSLEGLDLRFFNIRVRVELDSVVQDMVMKLVCSLCESVTLLAHQINKMFAEFFWFYVVLVFTFNADG